MHASESTNVRIAIGTMPDDKQSCHLVSALEGRSPSGVGFVGHVAGETHVSTSASPTAATVLCCQVDVR
jgi:hypothetical protein